jgi:hypothetical protein
VDAIRNGFSEASRGRDGGAPQLSYEVARLVDLRDGVAGRPPAPAGWGPNNSTLMPRRGDDEPGTWRADYAALFSEDFASLLGMPDAAGQPRTLCELAEAGEVHEVWLLVSGDKPDASLAEVLEHKQRYDAAGNKIPGSFDRCAGNGCFDVDVPRCDVSIRIGTVNLDRGPGCYLHSQGHGLEGTARRDDVPALSEWFLPFAGFDLGAREGLPFGDLYGVGCSGPPPEPDWGPGCVEHDGALATLHHNGTTYDVEPWDGMCGSVHFPPNARSHYDYGNDEAVRTTCKTFGTPSDTASWVSADAWSAFDAVTPDCGGGFLTWWFRQMPAFGSEHAFDDGRRMKSVWPYLFY